MTFRSTLRTALTIGLAMLMAMGVSLRRPNLQATPVESFPPSAIAGDADAPAVGWQTLAGLDLRTGVPAPSLRQFDGRRVRVPGYIVPLDDFAESVTEFLLVPYFGACIHMPPPPPNQMVHVKVTGSAHGGVSWARPVWVEGPLSIRAVKSPYGVVAFQMRAERITLYTEPTR